MEDFTLLQKCSNNILEVHWETLCNPVILRPPHTRARTYAHTGTSGTDPAAKKDHSFSQSCSVSETNMMFSLYWCSGIRRQHFTSSQCFHTMFFFFPLFLFFHLPMQKSLKIMSRISSAPTRPVIRPRLVSASRTPSAARARSTSRYLWYCARAATQCCRWALCRAWVSVGAPDRGSPHLQRKPEHKTNRTDHFCLLHSAFVSATTDIKEQKNKKQKPFAKSPIKINVLSVNNLTLCYLLGRLADNLQSLDAAVQHSQKVLQSLAGVTGEETNGRESGRTSQLPVQLLPLLLGQQVRFIQHQQNPVWRRDTDQWHDPCLLRSENYFFWWNGKNEENGFHILSLSESSLHQWHLFCFEKHLNHCYTNHHGLIYLFICKSLSYCPLIH